VNIFVSYPLIMTTTHLNWTKHIIVREWVLHKIKTAENHQSQKRGRTDNHCC